MAKNGSTDVIHLGTMIRGSDKTLGSIDRFIPIGIESVEIIFWESIPESINHSWMEEIAVKCRESGIKISSLELFTNPLKNSEMYIKAKADWNTLLDFADQFDVPVVSGFTGRIPGTALEASYQSVKDFYSPIVDSCQAKGLKLAFENCPMEGDRFSGDWNIAFLPEVWEILFNDFFPGGAVGLEFDPGHCVQLGLPVLELMKQWMPRIYHIHGKDAHEKGFLDFCFPGEGSTDWHKLFSIIQSEDYRGTVDLEGYHGKFVSHEHELEKQKKSLNYLKECRQL
jgi:sugar phosphate isomerase/epimerase